MRLCDFYIIKLYNLITRLYYAILYTSGKDTQKERDNMLIKNDLLEILESSVYNEVERVYREWIDNTEENDLIQDEFNRGQYYSANDIFEYFKCRDIVNINELLSYIYENVAIFTEREIRYIRYDDKSTSSYYQGLTHGLLGLATIIKDTIIKEVLK